MRKFCDYKLYRHPLIYFIKPMCEKPFQFDKVEGFQLDKKYFNTSITYENHVIKTDFEQFKAALHYKSKLFRKILNFTKKLDILPYSSSNIL